MYEMTGIPTVDVRISNLGRYTLVMPKRRSRKMSFVDFKEIERDS
jgi:hypothetical protein